MRFSAVVVHDSSKCQTKVLIHNLKGQEISKFIEELAEHQCNFGLPTLVPTLLLAGRAESAISKTQDCHDSIVRIEHDTAIKTKWHSSKACCDFHEQRQIATNRLETLDFDGVTRQLTSLLSKLAYCEFLANVHIPMLEEFDKINSMLTTNSTTNGVRLRNAERMLRAKNERLKCALKGVSFRAQFLSKRTQAQVQTVCG